MNQKQPPHQLSRRGFLRLGGQALLLSMIAGGGLMSGGPPQRVIAAPAAAPALQLPQINVRLVATDGFVSLPGRRRGADNGVYAFGFRPVLPSETFATLEALVSKYKGFTQWPSPILAVPKNIDLYLTMSNLGFVGRPDLDDAHTIHWHGFRNPNAVFDGVPEVSVSVPPSRNFPYFYRTRAEGTYMYHCHFEDVEHVQMGMDGVVYIQALNGRTYDSDSGVTAFHREFTLLLNEVWTTPHDNLIGVQETNWSDYKANYWVINGRSYPDTVVRDQDLAAYEGGDFSYGDPDLGFTQPVSSLIQLNAGETGLLRFANLGYEIHSMQLLGPRMTVVGHDATFLGPNIYQTSSVYIGPGEARDVLVTAPAYSASIPGGVDGAGSYNVYWLHNRNAHRLVNGNLPGLGGMVTQIRVYPPGTLPPQVAPNSTF
ncbi:MAG: multicopper oxidase domain-containing protein [Caldilineaceae bacterium]|nr:multicopper oxidase domain-containing protein [Caldilineaceae bacterium]